MQRRIWTMLCLLGGLAAPPAAAEPSRDAEKGWRRHGPAVVIEPNIDLSRSRRSDGREPDAIMARIEQCSYGGVRSFVDCLRGSQSSVTIRRIEACVASETIPAELERVAACIPMGRDR